MPAFTPLPEDKLKRDFEVLPEGDYDFEVQTATEERSSRGSDMIKLRLRIFSGSVETSVFDYLVFTEKAQWKLYGFAKAVGLVDKFKAGEINAFDCQGKSGRAHLKVDKSEGYEDKNTVGFYIPVKELPKPLTKAEAEDDFPF